MKIGRSNSLLASRNSASTSQAIGRALERLSTGKRVNSPRDGVADYSASLRLDSQIRGLSQVNLGINRAQGMLQVADSAISNQLDIVQRMREIAVEGANGTLDTSARKSLNSELQSLLEEFDRITKSTDFDGRKLLDGSSGVSELLLDETGSSVDLETPDLNLTEAFEKTIGTGSFETTKSTFGGDYAYSVRVADLNGDGNPDLVSTSINDTNLNVKLGNGNGSFKAITSYEIGNGRAQLTVGDFDSDGIDDIAVAARTDNTISVLIGNGDGSFRPRTTIFGGGPSSINSGDLNNDGFLDLVSASQSDDAINIYLNNGDGTFEATLTFNGGNIPSGVNIGDVNEDGNDDIVFTEFSDDVVSVALGNGDGSFQLIDDYSVGGDPQSLTLADLNGDGILDVAAVSESLDELNILIGNGDGSFQAQSSFASADMPVAVVAGDLNGDGVIDLAVGAEGDQAIAIYIGNGDGSYKSFQSFDGGNFDVYQASMIDINDLNGDGVLDIVSASGEDDALNILIGESTGAPAVSDVEVLSSASATDLIGILDDTVEKLTDHRADLGTLSSRLDQTQTANLTRQESLRNAKSLIEDADFALETAELVRHQVLQQAQVAVQGQANIQLQIVLGLFNF